MRPGARPGQHRAFWKSNKAQTSKTLRAPCYVAAGGFHKIEPAVIGPRRVRGENGDGTSAREGALSKGAFKMLEAARMAWGRTGPVRRPPDHKKRDRPYDAVHSLL
ncbi:hypothetical protein NDU88_003581 [Pleurodeles waltl]|uniref:Uncharacterized protein n=1 Tax=Pleurodeles waltl TaxID=8319 RepID=A0AAV7PBM1_PLEWA|nr:hypothetical protein NDU88_003581 [Pleurodeles waltl]